MALVTPHAWTAGDDATSTSLQTVTDAVTQLQGGTPTGTGTVLDFFRATQGTAQTALTISTFVSITFNATTDEAIDLAGGHTATNASRYVGQNAGWYEVRGTVGFTGSASGTQRLAQITLNGTVVEGSRQGAPPLASNNVPVATGTVYVQMNGTTDYVEVQGLADYASWSTVVSTGNKSSLHVKFIHS